MTLVDSNVLLDVLTDDPVWFAWSSYHVDMVSLDDRLFINDVIYAEISVRFDDIARLNAMLQAMRMTRRPMPTEALFLAGKAYREYRRAGAVRTGVLPDFFIGAQAAVENISLLTRDRRRYQTYFPGIHLITPGG